MEQTKVPIPTNVLKGLEAVRLSGLTNMFDVPMVIHLSCELGHPSVALWVAENKSNYGDGILRGFRVEGGETECAD